ARLAGRARRQRRPVPARRAPWLPRARRPPRPHRGAARSRRGDTRSEAARSAWLPPRGTSAQPTSPRPALARSLSRTAREPPCPRELELGADRGSASLAELAPRHEEEADSPRDDTKHPGQLSGGQRRRVRRVHPVWAAPGDVVRVVVDDVRPYAPRDPAARAVEERHAVD